MHAMTGSEYERYVVRGPLRAGDGAGGPAPGDRQRPSPVFMSGRQVEGANVCVRVGWIRDDVRDDPQAGAMVLDYDQILLHVGMDVARPQVLGGTAELYLGGQAIVFNTTTAVFIPKGTPYGPLTWKELQRPLLQLSIVLGTGDLDAAAPRAVAGNARPGAEQPGQLDYEQYVVRSPMREAGPEYVANRQNPTMTYMSGTQVPGVKNYIEFGWIWDVPSSPIPKMRHDNFDEIVLHLGSDPDNPEDLGATMQFGVGDDLLEFDTTHCAFIPKGLNHGPLVWREVRRPMIEFATMLGAGKWAEGWEGSFFDVP